MKRTRRKKIMLILLVPLLLIIFVLVEGIWIWQSGTPIAPPVISREPQTIGRGPSLTYAVMGDSTTISQGGDYAQGYAMATAMHLAKTHQVTWVNLGVSGARARQVATQQVPQAALFKPDIALVAVGANDVTHLTPATQVVRELEHAIGQLRNANPQVHIVLTGSPDMGSVPRFLQPVRWWAGERTKSLNREVMRMAHKQQVAFAPIAEKTGPAFRAHPELFAQDKFHPNDQGYALWKPVLIEELDKK